VQCGTLFQLTGGRTDSLPTNDEMNADAPKTALSKRRRLKQVAAWTAVVCLSVMGVCRLWRNQAVPSGIPEKSASRAVAGGGGGFFGEAARGVPLAGRGGIGNEPHGAGVGKAGRETLAGPSTAKGRVVALRPEALHGWGNLQEGERVALPWFGDGSLTGVAFLRMEDQGWVRFGGALEEEKGSFTLNLRAGEVNGLIMFPNTGIALEIRTEPGGTVLLVERPLESKLCWPAMAAAPPADAAAVAAAAGVSGEDAVPQVNTRPGARGLIYINFEGGAVTDPVWNSGKRIDFAPAALTASGILEVVARVAEDYAPFDMAVSTIWADYEAAPVGRRTRVIVTPTTTALPGSGGVAMVNGWSAAGRTMSSTVPAWVFASSPKYAAEGVSHEVGHTLGLNHDGTKAPDGRTVMPYYRGHGGDVTKPLSWAPIMGEAYTCSQTHWSRGEYAAANNDEDDIAIIKRKTNGVGYIDESFVGVRALEIAGGSFEVSGVVHHGESSAVYRFATLGGTLSVSLKPKVASYGNTDLKLEVADREGTVWAVSDPETATAAQVNVMLPEGAYSIAVSAGCTGPKPWSGYTTGYSTYGALGGYLLAGSLANPAKEPDLTSPPSVLGIVGEPFLYRPGLTYGAAVGECLGGWPLGVEWNSREQVLTGTPLMAGVYEVGFLLVEGARRTYRTVKITVHPEGLQALVAGEGTAVVATTPDAPWRTQFEALPWASAPGSKGVVATSGVTADGGVSRMRCSLPAGAVLNFWWKVSSESGCDFLECRLNGSVARDGDSGALLRISGVRDWSRQCVQVDGPSILEFVYRKDFALSEEQDRGWVAGLELGQRPVFTKMPQSQWLPRGGQAFALEAEAEHATGYQWKKDGFSLLDGEIGRRRISGARTASLHVTGAGPADSGTYVLEASNALGTQSSRRAEVGVPGAPVVTQRISAGTLVRAGDPLLLSVGFACAKPFFVAWSKDGRLLRWTQSPVYQLRAADASMSGRYSAVVINAYGSTDAGEVSVQVR
jgi:hypothetical protein